jgi:3D (Asp-Asp-Asp) domain-containing protein
MKFLGIVIMILLIAFMSAYIYENSLPELNDKIELLESELQEKREKVYELSLEAAKRKTIIEREIVYIGEEYEWEEFEVTGYSANDPSQGTNNIVATSFNLDKAPINKLPICAVDPDVIPLYSIIEIKGLGGFIALDTGGKIVGRRIDILFPTKSEAINFGVQNLKVRIIKEE